MSDRSLIRLTGPDTHDFLQGLVTNDVDGLKNGLVYAALLTPQGKYLADFFLVPESGAVLIDVQADLGPSLMQRLAMYKLRADVTIEPAALYLHRGIGERPVDGFDDPRHTALGWRAYRDTPQADDTIDWNALRVAHMIPKTGVELHADTFILEAGFEALNGVDFRKGCYVGQEVTARMKHKTTLRKGLARVALSEAAETGSEINASGKAAGTLHSVDGNHAIAYLRFDRAIDTMTAGNAIVTRI